MQCGFYNCGNAFGIDDTIKAWLWKLKHGVLGVVCQHDVVGTQLACRLQPARVQIDNNETSGDSVTDQLKETEADSTGSKNEHIVHPSRIQAFETVHRTGQRLCARCSAEG